MSADINVIKIVRAETSSKCFYFHTNGNIIVNKREITLYDIFYTPINKVYQISKDDAQTTCK